MMKRSVTGLSHKPKEDVRVTQKGQVLRRCFTAPSASRQVRYLVKVFSGEVRRIELILEIGYKGRVNVTDR